MEVKKGAKVKYLGDMANLEGVGEVVEIIEDKDYGTMADVKLEDGREFKRIFKNNFKHSGRKSYKFELVN